MWTWKHYCTEQNDKNNALKKSRSLVLHVLVVFLTLPGDSSSSMTKASWGKSPWMTFQWDDLWTRLSGWSRPSSTQTNTAKVLKWIIVFVHFYPVRLDALDERMLVIDSFCKLSRLERNLIEKLCSKQSFFPRRQSFPFLLSVDWKIFYFFPQCVQLGGSQAVTQWVWPDLWLTASVFHKSLASMQVNEWRNDSYDNIMVAQ